MSQTRFRCAKSLKLYIFDFKKQILSNLSQIRTVWIEHTTNWSTVNRSSNWAMSGNKPTYPHPTSNIPSSNKQSNIPMRIIRSPPSLKTGVEPVTSRLTVARSNQLSYSSIVVSFLYNYIIGYFFKLFLKSYNLPTNFQTWKHQEIKHKQHKITQNRHIVT